ncbi:MAG: dephospho-CoA kinase [Pseudomonadota bacterium]
MLKVGVTGGIASGKTQVSDALGAAGASVVDTDVISREVVAPGTDGLKEIETQLGSEFVSESGALDRAALRAHVFEHPEARRTLESITHPRIGAQVVKQLSEATGDYVVVVVPLLANSPLRAILDRILVVDCDPALQVRRLLARDGGSPELALSMIAAQTDRESRLRLANDVLDNSGSIDSLLQRCTALHHFYCQLSVATDTV